MYVICFDGGVYNISTEQLTCASGAIIDDPNYEIWTCSDQDFALDEQTGAMQCSDAESDSLLSYLQVGASGEGSVFDPTQLDPVLIATHVGLGFFILVPVWAAAMGAKYLLSMISIKR